MSTVTPTLQAGSDPGVLVAPPEGSDMSWICLHTRSRCEKKVSEVCRSGEVTHFLPMRLSVKRYGNRRREHTIPYFPGYLFCCATPEQRFAMLRTSLLVNAITVYDTEGLLSDLQQIDRALRAPARLDPFPYVRRGLRVRIMAGPMRGIEGVVSCRRGRFRVVLNVELIHRALALEVNADCVEPV